MTVNAKLRTEDFGTSGSRRLIRQGLFPAEMYGKNENYHLIINAHEFDLILRKLKIGDEVEVFVDGKNYKCIFKDLQENIMTDTLVHADFQLI